MNHALEKGVGASLVVYYTRQDIIDLKNFNLHGNRLKVEL